MKDYNDLVIKYRDLEDLSPHSKICWSQCPQILFIKPRDFVTFCHHQWKKDGSQIILNQAVDHDDVPAILEEGKASVCRAYALRGANCKYVLIHFQFNLARLLTNFVLVMFLKTCQEIQMIRTKLDLCYWPMQILEVIYHHG